MSYRLSKLAEEDLIAISRYSVENFGKASAKRYLEALNFRFGQLSEYPLMGRSRDEIKPGYFSIAEGSHVIFYKIDNQNQVLIIRVLHSRMDFPQHL